MSPQTSLETIHGFLACKRIAMIGISREHRSFSVMLFQELSRCGYDVVPVNPHTPNVLGHPCFARVQDVHPPVEAALLMTSPQVTEAVVADCARARIRLVWMHRGVGTGAVSPRAITFCREQGIEVIAGQCPFMFLPSSTGVHRLHRFFHKITGRYPQAKNTA
jgi:predicted CoA-binding protein